MSIVEGFGGMRIREGMLHFHPAIPGSWKSYSFKVMFRGNILNVTVEQGKTVIFNEEGGNLDVVVNDRKYQVVKNSKLEI